MTSISETLEHKRANIERMLRAGIPEMDICDSMKVTLGAVRFYSREIGVIVERSGRRGRRPRRALRAPTVYDPAENRTYPAPPPEVAAARDELVRDFFSLDQGRREELNEILRNYARRTVPDLDGRRSSKRWKIEKTLALAARHCYGCPARILQGDDL